MSNRSWLPTLEAGRHRGHDNLGSHKAKAVRAAIRNAGAHLFFLPPYSPDLNPIEQVFAKLKHLMRKAAERTVDASPTRIGTLLDGFTPAGMHQLPLQCRLCINLKSSRLMTTFSGEMA